MVVLRTKTHLGQKVFHVAFESCRVVTLAPTLDCCPVEHSLNAAAQPGGGAVEAAPDDGTEVTRAAGAGTRTDAA